MEDFPSPSFKQIASSNSGQKDEPPNGMFRTFSFGEFGEKFWLHPNFMNLVISELKVGVIYSE